MTLHRTLARSWILALAGLIALLSMAGGAWAQSVRVEARIEDGAVVVGKPFLFVIEVVGEEEPERPDLSSLADEFDVRDLGTNRASSVNIVNGQMKSETQTTFRYQMVVTEKGSYVIPPIPLRFRNGVSRTEVVRFRARETPPSDDFLVRIEVDNPTPFVGEPVELTLKLFTISDISLPRIIAEGDFGRFDVSDAPGWNGGGQAFSFLGDEVATSMGRETFGGRTYGTATVVRRLIPREPGPATIGPIKVLSQFFTRVRRGPFEQREPTKDVMAHSEAIAIDVKPLPIEGRPAGFAGLVGRYEIYAEVDPAEANVGDPVLLHVLVRGGPLLDEVSIPDLGSLPGFDGRLRVSSEEPEREFASGGVVFTTRIRALDDSVDAIPPIEIAYFDPERGEYGLARSKPLVLAVRPTRKVTAVDAVGSAPSVSGVKVEDVRAGIAHNYEGTDALVSMPTSVLAEVKSPVWVVSMVAPPLAYGACLVVVTARRRGRRQGSARRRSRALSEAQGRLREARTVDDVVAGVGRYFELVTGRPGASLTPRDAEAVVEPAGPEQAAQLRSLLERCDADRYAGKGVDDVRALREEARALLKLVDPELRRIGL